jgi:hypothetical protein
MKMKKYTISEPPIRAGSGQTALFFGKFKLVDYTIKQNRIMTFYGHKNEKKSRFPC